MTQSGKRDWRSIFCAAVIGASIAFPTGIIVGSNRSSSESAEDVSRPNSSGRQVAAGRDVYSPRVTTDPYVIEQQRKVAEALDVSCRQFDLHCVEAEQARLRIKEAEARH